MEQFKGEVNPQRTKEEVLKNIENRALEEAKELVDSIIFDVLGKNALSEWITDGHAGCLGCNSGWPKFEDMPEDVQNAWEELFDNRDTSRGLPPLDQNKLEEASEKYGVKVHYGGGTRENPKGIGVAGSICNPIDGLYGSVKFKLMEKETSYRSDLAEVIKKIDDKEEKKELLDIERGNPSYLDSKELHQLDVHEKIEKRSEEKRRQKMNLMHNMQNSFAESLQLEWNGKTVEFFQKEYEISDEEVREVAEKGIERYFWKLIFNTSEPINIEDEKIKKFIERFNFSETEIKERIIQAYLNRDIYYKPEKAVNISNHLKSNEGGLLEQKDVELISKDLIFSNIRTDELSDGGKWDIIAIPLIFQRELGISEEIFNEAWERAIAHRICSEHIERSGTIFGSVFEEKTRYMRAFAAFGISQDVKQEGVSQGVKRAATADYDLSYQYIDQSEDGVVRGFNNIRNYFGSDVLSKAVDSAEMSDSFRELIKNGLNRACTKLIEERNATKARKTEEGWNKFDKERKRKVLEGFELSAKEYWATIQEVGLESDFEEFSKEFDFA